jgi:hypothetical protein
VVADRCGHDAALHRQRFWRALAATALATASVFALIVGAGTFLLHAPGPDGIPRGVWCGTLVLAGIGLVPAWRAMAAPIPELPFSRRA